MSKKKSVSAPAKKNQAPTKVVNKAKSLKAKSKAAEVAVAAVSDEEDSDEAMETSSRSTQSSADAALAAVAGTQDSGTLKSFRHHPDMENFYRFIYENELRTEAIQIIDKYLEEKRIRKQAKLIKKTASH